MVRSIDLSIIVVSYNTKEITLNTLKSLYLFPPKLAFEVIVVDNSGLDGSAEEIRRFAKTKDNLVFIESKENLGFGGANNLATTKASGEYLLFLNSDTIFIEDCVTPLIAQIKQDKTIGALSCHLLNKDRSIQPNGGYFPTPFRVFAWQLFLDDLPVFSWLIKSIHPKARRLNKVLNLDWLTGAFLIIPKKVFEQVGRFDTRIFMYAEELELCYRIKQASFRLLINPHVTIVHLGRASSGGGMALTSEIKGILYFFTKHKAKRQLPFIKTCFLLGSLLRLLIFGIIKGNGEARKVYREAIRLVS